MELATLEKTYDFFHEVASEAVRDGISVLPVMVVCQASEPVGPPLRLDNVPKALWQPLQVSLTRELDDTGFALIIGEAWVSTADSLEEAMTTRPSEDPNRGEAVMFSFLGDGWQAISFCPIDRLARTLGKVALKFVGPEDGGTMVRQPPVRH